MSLAMISSPSNVVSLSMIGVDPGTEKHLSQIEQAIVEGEYFEGADERQIVIGSKLAELLEVALGDRVVLTVAEAGTGDLVQELFRVSGIFRFNVAEMDRGMVFVLLEKAQQMLGLEDGVHEIALKFTDTEIGRKAAHPFWQRYSADGNEALGWTELMPQLEAAFALADFSTLLIAIILFGVVALGIVNTLFMSLYERMFEFGVLRAVGTRPLAMGQMVMFEAGALAIVSIALGLAFGLIMTYISSRTGIDYTGIEYAGVTFTKLLYPVLQPAQFIVFPFWVFVFTVGIALYPATYAARLAPAKAMRRSF
jgi:ABC-type lipoprotein release transport system permease subunit